MFLAQAALIGVGVLLVTVGLHCLITPKCERAISKALDFDQR